jgi:putative ABC transport system permease protein
MKALYDLRDAWRSLRRRPGPALLAVATLALGIGASTAVFSAVRATLLDPLSFEDPVRLVLLAEKDTDGSPTGPGYATYVDWRARARSFVDIAVWGSWSPTLVGSPESEKVEGLRVSEGFFRLLGVKPQLGRDFLPAEYVTGSHRVVLLSNELWRRRFAASPGVVGSSIRIGEIPHTIVGVLPSGLEAIFSGNPEKPEKIYRPLGYNLTQEFACRTCRHLSAIARLKPGVPIEEARSEMNALMATLIKEHPTEYVGPEGLVTVFKESVVGPTRPLIWSLFAAVAFVVAIGCANVASVLVGLALARRREIAVRVALGASRVSIGRLFVAEGLLLAAAGGALGALASQWILQGLLAMAPSQIPRIANAQIDLPVLGFAALLSLACGLATAAIPALRTARLNPERVLREGAGGFAGPARRKLGGLLVAIDAALALLLLFGAGLVVRSAHRLIAVSPGFEPRGVLAADIHTTFTDDDPTRRFYEALLSRVRGLPGVTAVGAVSQLPLSGDVDRYGVAVEGQPLANPELAPYADRYGIYPGYLEAMGIPLRRGRGLTDTDRADTEKVVLVNETLARQMFQGEDPLGHRIRLGGPDAPWRTIVGVVGDVRHASLGTPQSLQVYAPDRQWFFASDMTLVLRTSADPAALATPLRAAVHAIDPAHAIGRVGPLEGVVRRSTAARRFGATLFSLLAGVAALLAGVGIFGVVSGLVSRATREIGIRMALGAGSKRVLGWVFARVLGPTAAGVLLGAVAAMWLGRLLASQLFEVSPRDPVVLSAVALLVLAVAVAAGAVPARRAMKLDPTRCLRQE